MPTVNASARATAEIQNPELFAPMLKELLEEKGDYAPRTIVVESDHSVYVEFGTGPARGGAKSTQTNVRKEIEKWVERKLGIADPKKRHNVAYKIYRNLMENGMPPQPYLRPAISKVMDRLEPTFFEDGGTIRELADLIVREMENQLRANDTIYTGELIQSIRVYEGDIGEESDAQKRIPTDVWNQDDVGFDGKRRAARYR